jgi:hypothetical protein
MPEVQIATTPEARPDARARARTRLNRAMKWVRRAHLYAGLFMVPWVFLYGATALLFNHPGVFPDQEIRDIAPADLAGTPLADFPSPQTLAGRIVEALNRGGEGDAPAEPYRLVRPSEASFSRDYITAVRDGDREHIVRLDLATRTGTLRIAAPREAPGPEKAAPFASRDGSLLDPPPLEGVARSMPRVLSRFGVKAQEPPAMRRESPGAPGGPEGRRAASRPPVPPTGRTLVPDLKFFMEGGGETWRVTYNLQTGSLAGRPADSPPAEAPSMRRFLLRLHLAHGFPSRIDARWFWAVAVDLMFVSMVGWGLTGLLMWWQMKNVRRAGAVVLAVGVAAALASAIGMHGVISGGP